VEDNSAILPATTINSKEKKISEDSSKIESAISHYYAHKGWVRIPHMHLILYL